MLSGHLTSRGRVRSLVATTPATIPVAPAKVDPQVYERAFEIVAAELRDGNLVCIFPEGQIGVEYQGRRDTQATTLAANDVASFLAAKLVR